MIGVADTFARDDDRTTTWEMWSSDVRQPTGPTGAHRHVNYWAINVGEI